MVRTIIVILAFENGRGLYFMSISALKFTKTTRKEEVKKRHITFMMTKTTIECLSMTLFNIIICLHFKDTIVT